MSESVPVASECDDRRLIERFLNGEQRSFNLLVERYRERIYLLIWRMVRNREDALDLSQDVFVKTYKNLRNHQGQLLSSDKEVAGILEKLRRRRGVN
jgi:hypothetical protein